MTASSSSNHFDVDYPESPLDSLARRRHDNHDVQYGYAYQPSPAQEHDVGPATTGSYFHSRIQLANPNLRVATSNYAPTSPLLHSTFSRNSFATISDDQSDWDRDPHSRSARSSILSAYRNPPSPQDEDDDNDEYTRHYFTDDTSSRHQYFPDDTSSIYSTNTTHGAVDPALRDSWATGATVSRPDYHVSTLATPTVVVTPAEGGGAGGAEMDGSRSPNPSILRAGPGRAPIVKPVTANFSRPVRDSGLGRHAEGERVTPQLPPDMRDQKMRVLERNRRTGRPPSPNGDLGGAQPPSSPLSLYSTYSYYPYESPVPSPPPAGQLLTPDPHQQRPKSSSTSSLVEKQPTGPRTPEEYLQLGIQHHEANRLGESARYFERSAKEGGGCGVGMLMYGLTLRHGWGCAKNEKMGFKWVMKAAECAVGDLEKVRTGGGQAEVGVVQTELVLAIYEVGQCFFHGWGVLKDQKMAVSYYAVAAQLGDGDAQADLAYCLANGKGCKKDKKEAAKWYQKAIKQGQSDVGLAWIYKDKYQ